jgi:hypothetical protein
MRRKNWMGVYSLLLIVILSIFSGAANPILQPAVTAVCYDLAGNSTKRYEFGWHGSLL